MIFFRTKRMLNAVNEYYFVKENNDGYFPSSEEKDRIADEVIKAGLSKAEGYRRVTIVPGTIFLTLKTKIHQINKRGEYGYRPRRKSKHG